MSTIRCDIVSAEAEIFHGEAVMVVATGELGELGITPRHAPLITRLKPGHIDVVLEGGERQQFYVPVAFSKCSRRWSLCWPIPPHVPPTSTRPPPSAPSRKPRTRWPTVLTPLKCPRLKPSLAQALAQLQALERMRKNLKH